MHRSLSLTALAMRNSHTVKHLGVRQCWELASTTVDTKPTRWDPCTTYSSLTPISEHSFLVSNDKRLARPVELLLQNKQGPMIFVGIGDAGHLSIAPKIAEACVVIDRDPSTISFQKFCRHLILDCEEPDEFLEKLYSDRGPVRLGYTLTRELLRDLKENRDSLSPLHFLDSKTEFQRTKIFLKRYPIYDCQVDVMNPYQTAQLKKLIARLRATHNNPLIVWNMTNVAEHNRHAPHVLPMHTDDWVIFSQLKDGHHFPEAYPTPVRPSEYEDALRANLQPRTFQRLYNE